MMRTTHTGMNLRAFVFPHNYKRDTEGVERGGRGGGEEGERERQIQRQTEIEIKQGSGGGRDWAVQTGVNAKG